MEEINYTSGLIWFTVWPIVIFLAYRFVVTNVSHLEENLENK